MRLDYFRRPDRWARWKRMGYIAAPVVAAGWIGLTAATGDRTLYSSGPLSQGHRSFEDDCMACHTQAWGALQPVEAKEHGMGVLCLSCHERSFGHDLEQASAWHTYEGERHRKAAESKVACSRCHLEHEGPVDLRAIEDSSCLECHDGVTEAMAGGPVDILRPGSLAIESFGEPDSGHPEMRWIELERPDPGGIAFSHGFHLRPGEYEAKAQELLRAGLRCDDCHRAGASNRAWRFRQQPPAAHQAPIDAGAPPLETDLQSAYMQPILYSLHCASCHPMLVDERLPGSPSVPAGAVPHDAPAVVRSYLRGQLLHYAAERSPDQLARGPHQGDLPLLPHDLTDERAVEDARIEWVRREVRRTERLLYDKQSGMCLECHSLQTPHLEGNAPPPRITPSAIPRRWLSQSGFDHAKHKTTACDACHTQVNDNAPLEGSRDGAEIVMLPDMAACASCHGPRQAARGNTPGRGGAPRNCVTCHTYHRATVDEEEPR
ncbi:MAG: cytochrome c3 family protein [Planctomycetota bacterium]|jgi:hypothetical protein